MSTELKGWATDMRSLYDQVSTGECSLEKAETLANVCGKALKAEALMFAREVFVSNSERRGLLPHERREGGEVVSTQ